MREHDHRKPRTGLEDPEGLRALLTRLSADEDSGWRHDAEAAALMRHAANKYAALARKHGLDPWDAAAAAFDAMRTPSVRRAEDPWAVVTRAVQVTCIAEERANGLLCSVHQARRPKYSVFHDAERFSDRDNPLTDYHPALQFDPSEALEDTDQAATASTAQWSTGVPAAVEDAIALLTLLGWPGDTARAGVDYVCTRLTDSSSRPAAFEALRRDRHARALLDLPAASWLGLLRILLGVADPARAHTSAGRGVLLRLLIGEPLRSLLTDDDLVLTVGLAAPNNIPRGGGR